MQNDRTTETDHIAAARERLIEAALPHVVFDGWTAETLRRAVAESGVDEGLAHLAFPRGGVDMALGYHRLLDARLKAELDRTDLGTMKIRDRITHAVRRRLELAGDHREAVRRGATLLALPIYAPESARAIWETCDIIWTACGDSSDDYNWYTKRAILASVYSSTVLYWLGDESVGHSATLAFLDRRIENVMQFEKAKAAVKSNPLGRAALWLPGQVLSVIRPPHARRGGGASEA